MSTKMNSQTMIARFVRKFRKVLPHRRRAPQDPVYASHEIDPFIGSVASLVLISPLSEKNDDRASYDFPPLTPLPSTSVLNLYPRQSHADSDLHFPIPVPDRPTNPTPYSLPTFGSEESLTSHFSRDRTSKDTAMLDMPAINEMLRRSVPSHPAISDNPPPFSRYSAPEPRRQQITRRATVVHQERLQLEKRCQSVDQEREQLATQLEVVSQELADAQHYNEAARHQIDAQDATIQALQEKCERLNVGLDHTARYFDSTAQELRELKEEHESCDGVRKLLEFRIEGLLKCRSRPRFLLKRKIDGLRFQLWMLNSKRFQGTGADAAHEEEEAYARDLLNQIEDQRRRIEDLEEQELKLGDQHDADGEALRESQTEMFQVYERLRKAERELRRHEVLVTDTGVKEQNLERELECLRKQLKDVLRVRPGNSRCEPLCRVRSMPILA